MMKSTKGKKKKKHDGKVSNNNIVDIAVIGSFSSALACALALLQEKETEDLDVPPRTIAVFGSAGEEEFSPKQNNNKHNISNNKEGSAKACVHLDPSTQFQELYQLSTKLCQEILFHGVCPNRYILQSGYNGGKILYNDRFFCVGDDGRVVGDGAVVTKICRATLENILQTYLGNRVQWHLDLKLESLEEIHDEHGGGPLVKLKFQKQKKKGKKERTKKDNDNIPCYYARLVVGVDGVKSVVRQELLQDEGPPHYTGRKAWQGVVNRKQFRSKLRETGLSQQYSLDDANDNDGEKILLNVLGPNCGVFCLDDMDEERTVWTVNASPPLSPPKEQSSSSHSSHNQCNASVTATPSSSPADVVLKALEGFPDIVRLVVGELTDSQSIDEFGIYTRQPVRSWTRQRRRTTTASSGDAVASSSTNPMQDESKILCRDTSCSRITLLGDAAHPMPSGPRFQIAVQDALTLARCLRPTDVGDLNDSAALAAALVKYEQERIAATTPLVLQEQQRREMQQQEGYLDRMQAGWNDLLAMYRAATALAAAMEEQDQQLRLLDQQARHDQQPLFQWSMSRILWLGLS